MQVTIHKPPTFFGVTMGETKYRLSLNKRELETIRHADAIVEQVRERLAAELGRESFEGSAWYTLATYDLADGAPLQWDRFDIDETTT